MGLCLYNIVFIFSFEKIYPESSEIECFAEVIDLKQEKEYKNKYIIKIIEMKNISYKKNYKKFKNTKIILYTEKQMNFKPGDLVFIIGNFEKADKSRNYKGFNYRNYLKQEKIYGIINSEKVFLKGIIKDNYYLVGKIKLELYSKLEKLYDKEYLKLLKSILFGNTQELDDNIKENFRNSSVSHILAISGMHITYIVIGISFILEKIIKSRKSRNYILVFLLVLFSNFIGNSVSCIRAVVMTSMYIFSFNIYRKNNFYISMLLSFFIILLINPFNILNIGMWLSYAGTFGIVKFYNFFVKVSNKKFNKLKNNIFLKYMFISVSAQILVFPIIIYVFNIVSLIFFISNVLISILIGYVIGIGYISIFLYYIFPKLAVFLSNIECALIYLIFKITNFCSNFEFSKIYLKTPNIIFVFMYYILIFYIVIKFKNNKFYYLKIILSKKYLKKLLVKKYVKIKYKLLNLNLYNFKKIKVYQKIIVILILIICILKISVGLKIYFIDVGQGDSSLIITQKGKVILIDGGEGNSDKYDAGEKILLPYLLDRGITKIDYLLISHMDSDHVGGIINIIENLKVKNIFIGIQTENSEQLDSLLRIAKDKNVKITILKSGMKIQIEKDTYINILWPKETKLINENKLNNNSLVFKFIYKDFSILFTGDIEKLAEKTILQECEDNIKILKSNVLKVAHHGSKTSSDLDFLEKVRPQVALIGVGKNNIFGHPNNQVIENLKSNGARVYRTDESGEISIIVNKKGKIINIKEYLKNTNVFDK